MNKKIAVLILSFFQILSFSQSNLLFQGYFSYNEIKDVSETATQIYVASENALFSKNLVSNDIKTTNTIDGLSGETISNIYHSNSLNKTLVGYESGLLIVINDADGSMFNAIGILQKEIPSNIKRINHFMEKDGIAYISCNFGIVQFNINTSEFGDTYFLGTSVSDYIRVIQTTIFNNSIYAVTQNNGIKKGDLNNPNLNDFSQWAVFNAGFWNGIGTLNNQLVASNTNNSLFKFDGATASTFFSVFETVLDFRIFNNNLIVTSGTKVIVFNNLLIPNFQISNSNITGVNPKFTCATYIDDTIYIGTLENGLYTTNASNTTIFENITPDGPLRNALFGINATSGNLWAVYGGYSSGYNPYAYNAFNAPNQYGISKYVNNKWLNIPYSQVLGAKALSKININPNNKNQVFISSYFSGLLKLENDVPTILYNTTNSGIENSFPNDIRLNGTAFDKTGNLWVTTSNIKNGLKFLKPNNTWQSVSLESIIGNYQNNSIDNLVIDKNGTKWFSTNQEGVIGYNETGSIFKKMTLGTDLGNLPIKNTRVVTIDNKNQLWIGTTKGLRVISVDSFNTTEQLNSLPIIILEEGLAQELFYEQFITDIVVDGANRKWVGTADSGVFLVSPNGQETLYHFTKDDSPLPSNTIMDIDINPENGEVFFATNKGMISFKGTSTKASDNLENVFIYPNPVRPEFLGTVKISGLLDKANIKISDIEGNLVFETTSEGGTIEWDTSAFGKYKVASGVYMVFISAQDGLETKVKKVMIIR